MTHLVSPLIHRITRDKRLSPIDVRVWLSVAGVAGSEEYIAIKLAAVASDVGSSRSAVHRCLQRLVDMRYLEQKRTTTVGCRHVPDLEPLRARARDLARNAPLIAGALDTKLTCMVGPGLIPHPRIDRKYLKLDDAKADEWQQAAARYWWAFAGVDALRSSAARELRAPDVDRGQLDDVRRLFRPSSLHRAAGRSPRPQAAGDRGGSRLESEQRPDRVDDTGS
jgi:hypothetical protein